jgi:uncharacterized protein YndB with AHSA1/START domain
MENVKSSVKDRELALSRTLNAPIDIVWEAFSQPEHIANWWGPDGFTNTIHVMDFRPGGKWEFIMHGPDGTDFPNKSVFKEIVLHKKIVFDHAAPSFTTTIEFEAQGEQTQLRWHMLFDSAEEFVRVVKTFKADKGLEQNVAKLNVYLEGRKAGR